MFLTSATPAVDTAGAGSLARATAPGRGGTVAKPRAAAYLSNLFPPRSPADAPVPAYGPPVTPADGFDLVVTARHRPILLRVTVRSGDGPAADRWTAALRRAYRQFDRDGDGHLNGWETPFIFPDATLAGLMLTGTYTPSAADLPTLDRLDRDNDRRVSFAEFAGYYRQAAGQAVRGFAPFADNLTNARATEALFALFDADGDGRLTRPEVAAAEQLLATKDADEDECLSLAELVPVAPPDSRRPSRPTTPPADDPAQTVGRYDLGRVPAAVTDALMKQYDRDADGRLTPAEVGFDADTFGRLDADHDGRLTAAELDGWRGGPPDVEAALALAPRAADCRAEVTTDAKTVTARGFTVRQVEPGRAVLRHGLQAVELWAYPSRADTPDGKLKERFAEAFKSAAGEKGYVAERNLLGAVVGQNQLLRIVFDPADADGDGKLTRDEFDRYFDLQQSFTDVALSLTPAVQTPTLFQLLDESRDGRLGVRELRTAWDRLAVLEPPAGGRPAEVVTRAAIQPVVSVRLTRSTDRGEPTRVSGFADPNRVVVPQRGPVWFRKMDRNADGDLSRAEYLGSREQFDAVDADRDGLISLSEAEAHDRASRR